MKDFLLIGPGNALGYHTLFPLFVNKVIKVGHRGHKERIGFTFNTDAGDKFQTAYWYTTLEVKDFDREFLLTKTYNKDNYPHFDNYPDIIEVKRCNDIPTNYIGIMAVPLSFFRYYPELDYEVIEHRGDLKLNGKTVYERLIIQKRK